MIKHFCECGHRIIPIETVMLHYHNNKITRRCQLCDCNSPRVGHKSVQKY